MIQEDSLIINGPSYQIIQPTGETFFLGKLLKKEKNPVNQMEPKRVITIYEFENMPTPYELSIDGSRNIPIFSISNPSTECCCFWNIFGLTEYSGPIYIQR